MTSLRQIIIQSGVKLMVFFELKRLVLVLLVGNIVKKSAKHFIW